LWNDKYGSLLTNKVFIKTWKNKGEQIIVYLINNNLFDIKNSDILLSKIQLLNFALKNLNIDKIDNSTRIMIINSFDKLLSHQFEWMANISKQQSYWKDLKENYEMVRNQLK